MQTGVKHAVESPAEAHGASVATAEAFVGLLCLETAAVTANLLWVVLVIVLAVVSLTSRPEGLVTVERLSETEADLLSVTKAELSDGLTEVSRTVAAVVILPTVVGPDIDSL